MLVFSGGALLSRKQVRVECVYEPPQENYPEGFEVSEDPKADTVEALAGLLGLKRVSQDRREALYVFSDRKRAAG